MLQTWIQLVRVLNNKHPSPSHFFEFSSTCFRKNCISTLMLNSNSSLGNSNNLPHCFTNKFRYGLPSFRTDRVGLVKNKKIITRCVRFTRSCKTIIRPKLKKNKMNLSLNYSGAQLCNIAPRTDYRKIYSGDQLVEPLKKLPCYFGPPFGWGIYRLH